MHIFYHFFFPHSPFLLLIFQRGEIYKRIFDKRRRAIFFLESLLKRYFSRYFSSRLSREIFRMTNRDRYLVPEKNGFFKLNGYIHAYRRIRR